MKKEKTFTIKLGNFKTVAHELEPPTPHIQKIMDQMTVDIHRAMFIGMDLGAGDTTSIAVVANGSVLTIDDLTRAMNMMLKNSPPLPPVKAKVEPKSEFKSWPYALED